MKKAQAVSSEMIFKIVMIAVALVFLILLLLVFFGKIQLNVGALPGAGL